MLILSAILASYLLGSIPTSYLVGRLFRGIDLREHGSGNLGASNLYRLMGLRFALPVALLDMGKGAAPVVFIAPAISANEGVWIALGGVAVLGHMFSIWVRFRGGKGAATGAGVVLALTPLAVLLVIPVWLLTVRLTRIPAVGSLLCAILLPMLVLLLYPEQPRTAGLVLLLCLGVVWAHRSNIRRLLRGQENRLQPR